MKDSPRDIWPSGTEVYYLPTPRTGPKARPPVLVIYEGKNRGEGPMANRHLIRIGNRTRWVAWYSLAPKEATTLPPLPKEAGR
jgi:hypothetical protein